MIWLLLLLPRAVGQSVFIGTSLTALRCHPTSSPPASPSPPPPLLTIALLSLSPPPPPVAGLFDVDAAAAYTWWICTRRTARSVWLGLNLVNFWGTQLFIYQTDINFSVLGDHHLLFQNIVHYLPEGWSTSITGRNWYTVSSAQGKTGVKKFSSKKIARLQNRPSLSWPDCHGSNASVNSCIKNNS